MARSVCIVHAAGNGGALSNITDEASAMMMYFSQDYGRSLYWKGKCKRIRFFDLGPLLQKKAEALKPEFSKLIFILGQKYDSPAWWASRVSERNSGVSPLFLYCCYLKIFEEQLDLGEGTLIIVGEDWAFLRAATDMARTKGWVVSGESRAAVLGACGAWFQAVGRIVKFLLRIFCAKIAGSDLRAGKSGAKVVLIHTYVDEAALQSEGTFRDRYFPGLADWLEGKGLMVVMLPVLLNLKRSVWSAWQWFRQSRKNFINPHVHYRISDYIYVLCESWRQQKMPSGEINFCGTDVTVLFHAERDRSIFACLDTLLYFRLPRRLKQAGFELQRAIIPFENMIDEKLLILGLRQDSPNTRIVSYQHGALYPLLPGNYISREEVGFSPIPDRVICNGEFFKEILLREGLPPQRLAVGPALRYTGLWERRERLDAEKESDILVPLALMESDAFELITKIALAFGDQDHLKIVIKPHPMTPLSTLLSKPLAKALPDHIRFVQGEMSDLLAKSHVMVAMSSSSSLEALAAGVPVVVVGRDGAIDLNPLGFFSEFGEVFSDPKAIRRETERLLALPQQDLGDYIVRGHKILEMCFSRKTDERMQVFLDDPPHTGAA